MAWRVTPTDVEGIIRDYNTSIDLTPFITMANTLADKVSSEDTGGELNAAQLFEIERLLSAHFYDQRDHEVDSSFTEKAGGKHTGQYGMHLERTRHGQDALMFDTTGYLRKISKGIVRAKVAWLGKPPSLQTDYVDRD